MLARAYADWPGQNAPGDEARAAIILGLLRVGLAHTGLPLREDLRLQQLAGVESTWPLTVPAEAVWAGWAPPPSGSPPSALDQRLASAQVLGEALDVLYGVESAGRRSGQASSRRSSGSYFTPRAVARSLVEESLATAHLRAVRERGAVWLCDPAMGGGAFLLEAVAGLARLRTGEHEIDLEALQDIGRTVYGYDQNELAVATAEAALYCLTGLCDWSQRLRVTDSLADTGLLPADGFDWILGNPPWVAFQGRAAQKLPHERRAWLRRTFRAFAGYPTLHGVFAERAAELAPHGLIALLLPSSLSDLDGYRAARAAVAHGHVPHEPLVEYGQDAFAGVVQPCFGLVASPRLADAAPEPDPGRAWRLRERTHQRARAAEVGVPSALEALAALPKLPAACFGELGLQSNRRVSEELFRRMLAPAEPFVVPLLEGRNVRAFHVGQPGLFMNPDPRVLSETRCKLRPLADYQRVGFVVRQTAAVTIAARHCGLRFRNSLLAGYAEGEFDVDLLVGLLNSALLRAFHASRQRDARQATFPQVKVAHLRNLPAPPADATGYARVRVLSRELSEHGPSAERSAELDRAVFDLYAIEQSAREEIARYLAPRYRGP